MARPSSQDDSPWAPKATPFRDLNPPHLLSPPTLHLSSWCRWACAWLSSYPSQGILTLTSGVPLMERNLTSAGQRNGLGSPAQVVPLLTLPHVFSQGNLGRFPRFPGTQFLL